MTTHTQIEGLKPFEARAIIEDIRKGTVPVEYVPLFTVGRDNWLKFIDEDLEHYIAEGGAKVRFINGDYGDGKTHFMSVVRHLSLEKGFAISFVVLTREVPIHRFEVVYQEIIRQLTGRFEGCGLRQLCYWWLIDLRSEMLLADGTPSIEKLAELAEKLRALPGMDVNFANALVSLVNLNFLPPAEGENEEDRQLAQETLYQWLEGGKPAKKDLKPFQIFENLSKNNGKRFLASLVAFLEHLDYKGLVLLMDELETVIAQSTSVRNAAYENVRLFIDNSAQASYLHIFFSIIPDVLSSEKGFKSYDALWSRVRSMGEGKRLNYRNVLIDLHRTPLETAEMLELGDRLRRIHEIAYRWEVGDIPVEKFIKKICTGQKKMGLLSEVRVFVKQVIRLLDMAEQGTPPDEEFDIASSLEDTQRELEELKAEHNQPSWDS